VGYEVNHAGDIVFQRYIACELFIIDRITGFFGLFHRPVF
jgi:hypothetical protein